MSLILRYLDAFLVVFVGLQKKERKIDLKHLKEKNAKSKNYIMI